MSSNLNIIIEQANAAILSRDYDFCYFTHTMTILTLTYKFYNSISDIDLQDFILKFPCK